MKHPIILNPRSRFCRNILARIRFTKAQIARAFRFAFQEEMSKMNKARYNLMDFPYDLDELSNSVFMATRGEILDKMNKLRLDEISFADHPGFADLPDTWDNCFSNMIEAHKILFGALCDAIQ